MFIKVLFLALSLASIPGSAMPWFCRCGAPTTEELEKETTEKMYQDDVAAGKMLPFSGHIYGRYDCTPNPNYKPTRAPEAPQAHATKSELQPKRAIDDPLLKAIYENSLATVKSLVLDQKADINGTGEFDMTPLHAAAIRGHTDIARWLVEHGAEVNPDNTATVASPLHKAVNYNKITTVEYLLSAGARVNNTGPNDISPLHCAASNASLPLISLLIEHGANVNAQNSYCATPLCSAIHRGDLAVVRKLIAHGAIVNLQTSLKDYDTPLHIAITASYLDIAQELLDRGANINAIGMDSLHTPLQVAIDLNNIGMINLLLNRGVDVNLAHESSIHPLAWATGLGNTSFIRALLQHGANPNISYDASDEKNITPLILAIGLCRACDVEILLKYGANVNTVWTNSKNDILSPLELAIDRFTEKHTLARAQNIKLLLDAGAKLADTKATINTDTLLAEVTAYITAEQAKPTETTT